MQVAIAMEKTSTAPIEINGELWRTQVEQMLIAHGQRLTSPRVAILRWIASTTAPFTAETLVAELVDGQHIGSRPTVYRTVDWLRSEGWIARVQIDGLEHSYARMLPGHYHHAVCTDCGATLVLAGCEALQSLTASLEDQGFEVRGHILELFGVCRECR